ncbi:MAG: polysaccharide deacetylase family protein [Alphaproteobacteria bacterium]|nr:polysaccharide deacetylase family protein [Alphaproteobacteria bacterium]
MHKAYLTIDDGPSEKFTDFVDFLGERNIPAVFFNRGDYMEARPDDVIYGIKKGYIMANHTYSHRRASELSFEENCAEIKRTDEILEDLYKKAEVERPGKYFRFPYMDRGMGPWLADPEDLKEEYRAAHLELLQAGLGHKPQEPDAQQIEKKDKLQAFLKSLGYEKLPVKGVKIPWYAKTEMGKSIDSLCTYSTSDWALLERHKGSHGFSTVKDLMAKMDNDPWLNREKSNHIILAHEQAEIHGVTKELVEHFLAGDWEFLDF